MRPLPLDFFWWFRDSLCERNYVPVRVLDCELAHPEPLGSERHDYLYKRCDSRVDVVDSVDLYEHDVAAAE